VRGRDAPRFIGCRVPESRGAVGSAVASCVFPCSRQAALGFDKLTAVNSSLSGPGPKVEGRGRWDVNGAVGRAVGDRVRRGRRGHLQRTRAIRRGVILLPSHESINSHHGRAPVADPRIWRPSGLLALGLPLARAGLPDLKLTAVNRILPSEGAGPAVRCSDVIVDDSMVDAGLGLRYVTQLACQHIRLKYCLANYSSRRQCGTQRQCKSRLAEYVAPISCAEA
jgi:hypothetical protein